MVMRSKQGEQTSDDCDRHPDLLDSYCTQATHSRVKRSESVLAEVGHCYVPVSSRKASASLRNSALRLWYSFHRREL